MSCDGAPLTRREAQRLCMKLRSSSSTKCIGSTADLLDTARHLCSFQTSSRAPSSDIRLKKVKRGACAVGWDASQRGLYVGIGVAGNAGRFGGACGRYVEVSSAVERHRQSMTAAMRFQTNRYMLTKLHSRHETQEESVISNMETTADHLNKKDLHLLSEGRLKIRWGLVHPKMPLGNKKSTLTFQGVDYTRPAVDGFKKYEYAAGVPTAASFQELGEDWDLTRNYQCVAVFTAGPNNGRRGSSNHSSMTRTVDPDAANYDVFCKGIVDALVATLREMKRFRVECAVLPGISTGIYAGNHRARVRRDFMGLLSEAIERVGPLGTIKEIVYATG